MSDRANMPGQGSDIAVVGMALKVPGARNVEGFWRNLADGVESITPQDDDALKAAGEDPAKLAQDNYVRVAALLEGYDHFDPDFFGFGPKEAAILDPQHRKFLEVSWEAMEQAGHVPQNFPGRIGVYAGCGMGSYFYFNICSNPDLVDDVGMFLLRHTGNDKDFLSTRVSHVFDLRGPSLNIQTACSTSLVAVHQARQALMRGECDMALAGGVTIELPQGRGYLYKENEILSPDGHCHAFDHRAAGTVFGSGAGVVALRRLEDAVADGDHVWAVIRGSAINNDGAAKAGYLAPSVDGQAEAVRAALRDAGVTPGSIGYVECHGTGTYLGDPIEVAALTEAFGPAERARTGIGSVKTNIGHLDTAAGVVSLIKACLSLHHGQMAPSLGYEAPNPAIGFEGSPFYVNDRLSDWPGGTGPRRAGVNSLGVGGTNAHAVIEQAPARAASEPSDWPFHILPLSAKSKGALDGNAGALAAYLRAHPEVPLADVAYTLKTGRAGFDRRRVLVADSHEEAARLLEEGDATRVFSHEYLGADTDVVFMFPGGGAQYTDMARGLYETEPVFAEWMDRGLTHLEAQLDYDIRALWLPDGGNGGVDPARQADARAAAEKALRRPSVQLPLIMIVEFALARLWESWGVAPAAMVGHSMGENTAACLAGVMSFEDCIDLVLLRGRLFDTVPAGGMLSVSLPEDELRALIGEGLDMASVNAPDLCAVSGPDAELSRLADILSARGIEFQRIAIDIAAHSRMLEPILAEYRAFLQNLDLKPPARLVISNRTGVAMTPEQATDPDYWVGQLRNTVRFGDCMAHLATRPNRVFLEVGPGKALSALTQMQAAVKPGQVLSSLRHPEDNTPDDKHFLRIIGRLWAAGVEADWDQIWGEARRNRVVLPTYQFQSARYFIEPGAAVQGPDRIEVARHEDMADWGYREAWVPTYADCEAEVIGASGGRDGVPQSWLVFVDGAGLAAPLVERLRAMGSRVSTVTSGDSFLRLGEDAYVLAPEVGRDGYDALMAALAEAGALPGRIAHFWGVTAGESFRPGSSFFDRNMEHGFFSLVYLAQAMGGVEMPEACHLTVFTNGATQVADEALCWPEKATVAGPVGVIPREFPGVTVAHVDLPADLGAARGRLPGKLAESWADTLIEDVLAEPANLRAAHRDGRRLEARLKPVTLREAEGKGAVLRPGGTYLITGGLGGMGLSIARMLARDYSANIALVSRKGLPPRETWDDYLDRSGGTGPVAAALRACREVEALGGTLRVMQGDVTDVLSMQEVAGQLRREFGAVTGVLHAAGHIDDAPILAKDAAGMQAVLAPKITGLRVLEEVFADGAPELMVLFASTSTAITPAGQVDYVAANAYLNAYARSRTGGETRVMALNWGVWAEAGMAADAVAARTGTREPERMRLDLPLLRQAGAEHGSEQVLYGELDGARDWVLSEHRTRTGQVILPGTGTIELAAQALAARGIRAPFEIRDLMFLRPMAVTGTREIEITLRADRDGLHFALSGAAEAEGQRGQVTTAEAVLAPLDPGARPGRIDPGAIVRRCGRALDLPFRSPQQAHLEFGPRWDVVTRAAMGDGQGIAHLRLPEAALGDLAQGYRLHPALLDIATGWAIGLVPGYAPDHLWVPMSYATIRVWRDLPERIVSHVVLREGAGADMAGFDITLCGEDGEVYAEIGNFQMRRLEAQGGFALPRLTASDLHGGAEAHAPLSRSEARLIHNVARGITPDEGGEAFRRALETGTAQIYVSSLDLVALGAEAGMVEAPTAGGGQSFERPDLDSDFVAPEGPVEGALAELWQGILGIEEIGAEDSFFDLGGHSLLAVRLFAQVKRAFGVEFPISVLFEAPTVRAIAARIEARGGVAGDAGDVAETAPEESREFRHAVALHSGQGGSGTPFFVVAGMFGNVMNLRHLATLLGEGRPVYGLQARGLVGGEAPHETIPEAAAAYIEDMRHIQPEGPYMIGGFSGGGITAYEIARQLAGAGHEVAAVVMLDTPLPVRPGLGLRDKVLIKLHELRRKGVGYLGEWARDRLAWEAGKRRRAKAGETAPDSGGFDNEGIEQAFRRAVAVYNPAPWEGPLTLFRPRLDRHWAVSGGQYVSREREYVYADNQWTQHAPKIAVIEVPGDHDSMVLVPNVSVLARHIATELAEADARGPHGNVTVLWPGRTAAE